MRCIVFHYTAVCIQIACVGSLEGKLQAHEVFAKRILLFGERKNRRCKVAMQIPMQLREPPLRARGPPAQHE